MIHIDIWLTNVKEKTTAKFAHVFMTLIQTNLVSRQRTNISNIPVSRD